MGNGNKDCGTKDFQIKLMKISKLKCFYRHKKGGVVERVELSLMTSNAHISILYLLSHVLLKINSKTPHTPRTKN